MRLSWIRMAFAVTLSAVVMGPVANAVAQQVSSVQVDVNLKDADLLTATRMLTGRTGIQFLMEPTVEPFNKITLDVKGVTAEDAIRYICQAAGANFRRDENGVYIIGHSKPKVADLPSAAPTKIPRVVRKLRVLKAGVRDVYDMLVYKQAFDPTRGFTELKRFAALTAADTTRIFGPSINANTGQTTPVYQASPTVPTSTPLVGAESGNGIVVPSEGSNQIGGGIGGGGGGGGLGGGGGIGGGAGGGQGGGLGGGAGGQGGGSVNLQGGQGLIGESIDFISFDPTDNSLVVRGSEEDIQSLQTYINLFDVAPKQVLIKVEFITTTETLDKSLGTEFLYNRGTVFAGTRPGAFARSGDPVFINYASGNVTARLRTSLTEGNGKVVNAPILRTLNNQPATIQSSITTYIFINQVVVTQGVIQNVPQPLQLNATTQLSVAPRINEDGTITLYLTPQISNFVGTSRGPDGSEIPNQVTQAIAVVARVRNNETIVLGGLTSKADDNSVSRVPVLSELPVIGQFFRFTRRNRTNNELLIFVTPSVVDEDTTGNPGGP